MSTWRALLVDEVDEVDLYLSNDSQYQTPSDLPTTTISVPSSGFGSEYEDTAISDQSHKPRVAIVSWRWDGDARGPNPARRSLNIFLALQYAKKIGIRHLLIDVVSIDQKLQKDLLIEQVLTFSNLYGVLPVFCSYGMDMYKSLSVLQRPWIHHELSTMGSNPSPITYIGSLPGDFTAKERKAKPNYGAKAVSRALYHGLTEGILDILGGQIEMSSVSDLKFIMPLYGRILSLAYNELNKEDYLMVAGILAETQRARKFGWINSFFRADIIKDILGKSFERFSFSLEREDPNIDVYLEGSKIARFQSCSFNKDTGWYELFPEEVAERQICATLGLPENVFEDYLPPAHLYEENYRASSSRDFSRVKTKFLFTYTALESLEKRFRHESRADRTLALGMLERWTKSKSETFFS